MARGLQIGRRIPIGEESAVLPLAGEGTVPARTPTSLEQDGFAETLENVERAPEGALPQITTESFLTQEEAELNAEAELATTGQLDFATQQIIAQGQRQRAEVAFARTPRLVPTVSPIQAGAITTPFLGTTPIFTGGGVRLSIVERRNAMIKDAAGKAAGKPSDEELSVPFQNERQFRQIAARSNIDATNAAFAEAIANGIPIQDISAILANPNTKLGRKFQQAKSDIEVLAIEATGLDSLADDVEELGRSLDITLSRQTKKEIDDIRRGAADVLEGLGKGDLGEKISRIKTQASTLAVLNAIRPNLTASIESDDIVKAQVEGISFAQFATQKAREFLTEEGAEAAISLSGEEGVINEFGRDKFKNQLRILFEKELREQWRAIRPATRVTIQPPADKVTAAPKFIAKTITGLGEASKQTDTGVSSGSVLISQEGNILSNGAEGIRVRVGDSEKFISNKNLEGLKSGTTEFFAKKIGIGSGRSQADVEEVFTMEDIRNVSKGLTLSLTARDKIRLNTLDVRVRQIGIDNVGIEDVIELAIRRVGSADAGNGEMATDIIRHKTDADANVIQGWNLRTQSGLVGISIPTKTWNAEAEGTGFFGFFQDQNRIAIGDEKVFLQDAIFLKRDGKWVLAGKDGRALEVDGENLEFDFGAIESPFRGELKNINEGLSLRGAEVISTKITKVPAGTKPFALGAETEIATERTPAQDRAIEDTKAKQGGAIKQNQLDWILENIK